MFHYRITVQSSPLHGRGIFVQEKILKGAIVYTIREEDVEYFPMSSFCNLSQERKKEIRHFGYLNKADHAWYLAKDEIRYCNHATEGNISLSKDALIATRDIDAGEELTQNYAEFEDLREELQ